LGENAGAKKGEKQGEWTVILRNMNALKPESVCHFFPEAS
jgi:hypothetical protein